jgi:hypothetical protein
LNKKPNISSFSSLINIPKLSSNPSRVDRLIVEAFREYSKICLLFSKLDNLNDTIFFSNIQLSICNWLEKIQNVQAKRREEIANGIERQKLGQPMRSNDDKGF